MFSFNFFNSTQIYDFSLFVATVSALACVPGPWRPWIAPKHWGF